MAQQKSAKVVFFRSFAFPPARDTSTYQINCCHPKAGQFHMQISMEQWGLENAGHSYTPIDVEIADIDISNI